MKAPRLKVGAPKEWLLGFFLAAILSAPAWADVTGAKTAVPGTLNHVEGQVSMGDRALNSQSIGTAELQPGESLVTEKGKAEVLLTPGVFLRIGNNSSVKMISHSRKSKAEPREFNRHTTAYLHIYIYISVVSVAKSDSARRLHAIRVG
jgi:hypothetical protein